MNTRSANTASSVSGVAAPPILVRQVFETIFLDFVGSDAICALFFGFQV
jgi:hypothetical protein